MSRRGSTVTTSETVRCAIYVRTSSDERLKSDFNSLDAQTEACRAYIRSQQARGWVEAEVYSDGGFSGKDTERPALQRLLQDVQNGHVDAVVTYKLDRISRSLRDFVALMADFETHNVACVSVTQAFDTNTPMGRLTMHILLSFAEFEREVIGERIRDKICASRRRGKWTGGTPILGYDVDRSGGSPKLVTNPDEASRVCEIFDLYLELGALLHVVAELERRGWRNKVWTTRDGRQRGGQAFDKARLHSLLTNTLYVGQIRYRGETFTGEHEAIIGDELFARVQKQLQHNGNGNAAQHRNRHGALLRGLLFCKACGRAMSHTFTSRGGCRYRYYSCNTAMKRGRHACATRSLPAAEIERAVVDELRTIGRDPALLKDTLAAARQQTQEARARLVGERRVVARGHARLLGDLQRANGEDALHQADLQERIAAAERRLSDVDGRIQDLEQENLTAADVAAALGEFDGSWAALSPREQARIVQLLVQRVTFDATTSAIRITFHASGIRNLAEGAR